MTILITIQLYLGIIEAALAIQLSSMIDGLTAEIDIRAVLATVIVSISVVTVLTATTVWDQQYRHPILDEVLIAVVDHGSSNPQPYQPSLAEQISDSRRSRRARDRR